MNSKQRVLAALDSKQPDKVPIFELYMNESSIVGLAKLLRPEAVQVKSQRDRFGEESYGILDLYCFIVEELQLDTTSMNFSIGMEVVSNSHCQDKYGTVYSLSEHGEPIPDLLVAFKTSKDSIWHPNSSLKILPGSSM